MGGGRPLIPSKLSTEKMIADFVSQGDPIFETALGVSKIDYAEVSFSASITSIPLRMVFMTSVSSLSSL